MNQKHIVILGAGISGLASAWFLKKKFGNHIHLTILEKSFRTGGWIQTIEHEGFLFELGPHSLRSKGNGEQTLRLIQALGLEEEVVACDSSAHHRYLYINQSLRRLPHSLLSLLFSSFAKDLLKPIACEWFVPSFHGDDETIEDFIHRRLSPEIARTFIDPLTTGIYAGDIRQLSIKSCFPLLHSWEKKHGSILKGLFSMPKQKNDNNPFVNRMQKSPLFSFKNGMETLVKTLKENCNAEIISNCLIDSLVFKFDGIEIGYNHALLHADYLISAIPSQELFKLIALPDIPLKTIPSTSVAVVNIGYRRRVLKLEGFGYLIPSQEKEEILGVIWDSSIFPQQNRQLDETRLTVMLGGEHHPYVMQLDHKSCINVALKALSKHLQIDIQPDAVKSTFAHYAIPQYYLGHTQKIEKIEQSISKVSSRIALLGSSFYGVSINDCIANAKKMAEKFAL